MLFSLYKKAGTKVSLNSQASVHELTMEEVQKAKEWLHSSSLIDSIGYL